MLDPDCEEARAANDTMHVQQRHRIQIGRDSPTAAVPLFRSDVTRIPQALDLSDPDFDAVFSIFGVFMFPDWRKGLAEMARVTKRP